MRVIAQLLLGMAALALGLLAVLVAAETLLGLAGVGGIPGARVLRGDLVTAVLVLPLASATFERAHLSISLLSDRLGSSERARLILAGHVAGLLALLPILRASGRALLHATGGASHFAGLALLVAGLGAMWLVLAAMLGRDLRATRDLGMVTDDHGHEAF